ncbi:hypothetical protein GCM10008920_15940 [Pediococcus acidilactici]|nr:hypothetical protein GCM10008920_15940 [Pediococcus acidilactici]
MSPKNRTLKAGLDHLLTNGNQKIVFGRKPKNSVWSTKETKHSPVSTGF